MFYLQHRDVNRFLHTNNTVSRRNYLRILALASIDITLTLPLGLTNCVLTILAFKQESEPVPFYLPWDVIHADWTPVQYTYPEMLSGGTANMVLLYLSYWTSPVLAFTIFLLFGVNREARASYARVARAVCARLGWKTSTSSVDWKDRATLDTVVFTSRDLDTLNEVGYVNHANSGF